MYKIVTTPNSVLVQKAQTVSTFDKKLKESIAKMTESLLSTRDPIGVGLAAPQVGLSIRIFLMRPKEDGPVTTYINPVVKTSSEEAEVPAFTNSKSVEAKKPKSSKKRLLEGCLSVPNIWGNVARKRDLTLSWQDEDGKRHTKKFKGFAAVIIQHETDHLNGILFTKHVMEQGEKLYKSYKNEKGEDEFEEIKI